MWFRTVLCAGVTLAAVGLIARGDLADWQQPAGGIFQVPQNWTPGGVPGSQDIARFNIGGAYTVTLAGNRANQRMLIGDDKLVFDLNGYRYRLLSTGLPSLTLGLSSPPGEPPDVARVTFRNGIVESVEAEIGSAPGSSGSVIVSTDARWNNSALIHVGAGGTGNVTITRGAKVTSNSGKIGLAAGTTGTVTISSNSSSWSINNNLFVGGRTTGNGTLTIRRGAALFNGKNLEIREGGTVNIDGGTLDTGSITRAGKLNFNAGLLHISLQDLMVRPDGPLTDKFKLTADHELVLDQDAFIDPGSLVWIQDGKYTAINTFNSGEIRLDGEESSLVSTTLVNSGQGLIQGTGFIIGAVENNGQMRVNSGQSMTIRGALTNNGLMEFNDGVFDLVTGGGLINSPLATIRGHGQLLSFPSVINTGLMDFTYGPTLLSGDIFNEASGRILIGGTGALFGGAVAHNGDEFSILPGVQATFDGPVSGEGSFTGGGDMLVNFMLSPGNAAGAMSIQGNLTFGPGAVFHVDLGPGTDVDQLDVEGFVTLEEVEFAFDPFFSPAVGDSFVLIRANSITYNQPISAPSFKDFEFVVMADPDALILSVVPEPSGTAALLLAAALAVRPRRRTPARI